MAQSYVTFTGNGSSTGPITLGFNYILKAHVKVYESRDILANTGTLKSETTHYTFNTAGTQISMVTAPANGVVITIERQTPNDDQIVPYADGSNLIADSLNNSDKQTLFCTQELEDRQELSAAKAIASQTASNTATTNVAALTANYFKRDGTLPMTGNLQLGTNKITAVGDPTSAQDVVTKAFLERTGSIASAQIVDGTIVDADVNASAAISGSKLQASSGSAAGTMSSANFTKLAGIDTGAKDDQTGAEIKSLYEAQSDTNAYTDAEKTKLTSCESNSKDDQTSTEIKSLYESNSNTNAVTDAEKTNIGTITNKQPLDAELTTLSGMQSGTASILASNTALTSTTAELNLLDGKSVVTAVSGSSTDVQLPTAKAVNDQIVNLLNDAGGFVPIASEVSFPNANPDPNDGAGTIVSIADAGGVVVNGSGVSTTGRTLGGAIVTINGIDSSLNSSTIAAGKGMLVQTTSTLNTYTYHRLVVDEAGVANAQSLVSDFGDKYQISGSAPTQHPDGSALVEGDLWFDSSANVMKVHDGSNYAAVTSVGDYKLLTVVPDGATSGTPTFNGSNLSFDLRDGGSGASITSVGQLLVSLNGVLQKPNSTSWSASNEGFHLEGTNGIKFCTAPPSGSSIFVTLIGSATSVNVPATNSVIEAAIQTNVVSEEKLKISNSPTNGKYLQAQSGQSGGLTWADVGGASSISLNNDTPLTLGTDGDFAFRHFASASGNTGWVGGSANTIYTSSGTSGVEIPIAFYHLKTESGNAVWHPELILNPEGSVDLYFNAVKKLETSNTGISVTGTVAATSFTGDGSNLTGITSVGGATGVQFNDTVKATFGTTGTGDLEISHDGTDSWIKNNTGVLAIAAPDIQLANAAGNEQYIRAVENGSVQLFYDNTKRFETYSAGVEFHGNLKNETDGSNNGIYLGAANDLGLFHDGTNSYIQSQQGELHLRGATGTIRIKPKDDEDSLVCVPNGAVELYHNGVKAFETLSSATVKVGGLTNNSTIIMSDSNEGDRNIHCNTDLIGFLTQGGGWGAYCDDSGDWFASSFSSSDQNLKKDITATDLGLSFVNKLNPVSFTWKDTSKAGTHYGLIAQEVETILKEEGKDETAIGFITNKVAVKPGKDEPRYYGLNYSELISPLIKAVQELSAEVVSLKTKVTALEAK